MWAKSLSALYESHLILFVALFCISYIIYLRFFRRVSVTTTSGSIVMAISIFAVQTLPEFYSQQFILLIAALEVFIVWLYLANGVLQAYFAGELQLSHFTERMGVGTWVVGTALTALLLDQVEHTLHGYIVLLGIIAVVLWFVYMVIVARWLYTCFLKHFHIPADGMILLATVSTQSIVLLLNELFHHAIPAWFYQGMIIFGFVFYIIGFCLILHYVFHARRHHIAISWPAANSINHGALAITGLALISSRVFPEWIDADVWWLTAFFFIVVEFIEILHLIIRVRLKGLIHGVMVYDHSQWARIFTFGIFYTFTVAYHLQDHDNHVLVSIVANYGQYVVAMLLLIELILVFTVRRQYPQPRQHNEKNQH